MAVELGAGAGLAPGKPNVLFEDKNNWENFDVARDGRLLVTREAADKSGGTQINIVLHWFDELRQKMAAK